MRNNTYSDVLGMGSHNIFGEKANIVQNDVFYAPSVKHNLLSISELDAKDFETRFKVGGVIVGKKDVYLLGIIR